MTYTLDTIKNEWIPKGIHLVLDFKESLNNQTLMLDMGKVTVTGSVKMINSRTFSFNLKIETLLTLPCAISLKPVLFPLSFLIEDTVNDTDSEYLIVEDKIDIESMVWGAIIPEIPPQVYADGVDHEAFSEQKEAHPAFVALKDEFYKK